MLLKPPLSQTTTHETPETPEILPTTTPATAGKAGTIDYGGRKLTKRNQTGANVPTNALPVKLPMADKKALAIAIEKNIPALLIGETGTGKTSAIKELAYRLKQNYTRISLTGYTTPDELIGSKSVKDGATYYENGILTNAMINGHICVLDELNAITPDCSFIIHSLLDDERKISLPNGDIIKPHADFRIFATINPDYEGTKTLNKAFLDRFGILIFVQILTPANEEKLLIERTGISPEIAKKFIATAWLNRKAYTENKTATLISTRSLIQTATLLNEGMTPADAYRTAIVNKARTDEHRAFMDFYNIIFKTDETTKNYLPEILTPEQVKQRDDELQQLRDQNRKYYEDINEATDGKREADERLTETQKLNRLLEEKVKLLEENAKHTAKTTKTNPTGDDRQPVF